MEKKWFFKFNTQYAHIIHHTRAVIIYYNGVYHFLIFR